MYLALYLSASFLLLLGVFFLGAFQSALKRIPSEDSTISLKSSKTLAFLLKFYSKTTKGKDFEAIHFASYFSLTLLRFAYFFFAAFSVLGIYQVLKDNTDASSIFLTPEFLTFVISTVYFTVFFIFGELLPRALASTYPKRALKISAPICAFIFLLFFPFAYVFYRLVKLTFHSTYLEHLFSPSVHVPQEILDMLKGSHPGNEEGEHEKLLIESVARFQKRIVREVMVPRVDVFGLPAETPIDQAAALLDKEGFSRVPVYRDNIDNIIGVLMYKDILKDYMSTENKELIKRPIETVIKGVLYTPETKKISHLLQEFRRKQVHFAIVVDEYGGTEGIVTIEDILEQIVGDISDEYDEDVELFVAQPDGSWIIDARMSIHDVEEKLEVQIPQEGDYDTVAGYIFHCAGTIPAKGFIIHSDQFQLEVLSSSDRSVEKICIRQATASEEERSPETTSNLLSEDT